MVCILKVTNEFTTNMEITFARSYICLTENDLLIFGIKIHAINYEKSLFVNNIDKKDLDEVEVILGFKTNRSEKGTFLMNLTKLRIS